MDSGPESSTVSELTPAQRMALEHDQKYHNPVVEDVSDENDTTARQPPPVLNGTNGVPMSEKAAGKQKLQDPVASDAGLKKAAAAPLDLGSQELFPSLGPAAPSKAPATSAGSRWGQGPASTRMNGTVNGSSQPSNSAPAVRTPAITLPFGNEEAYPLLKSQLKTNMKRSLAETLNDVSKGTGVKLESRRAGITEDGEPMIKIAATGSNSTAVRNTLRKAILAITKLESRKISIPASSKAQLIGKGGSKIKEIQAESGAKIQLPPASKTSGPVDDEEVIEATVEGDPFALAKAIQLIHNVVGQAPSEVRLAMTNTPPELFGFLRRFVDLKDVSPDVKIRIPEYQTYGTRPPPAAVSDFAAQEGHHISLSGPSELAKKLRAELEAHANELQQTLQISELLGIERQRHQFILGSSGMKLQDFVSETGCTLILPPASDDTETIYVVGPAEQLELARNKAMDLAGDMIPSSIDISKTYQGPKEFQAEYLQNLTRYMRRRKALDSIMSQHNAQVAFPSDAASPWTLWTREPRVSVRARTDVLNAVSAHPYNRFRNVNLHPFYQKDLEKQHARQLRQKHGVHLVVPDHGAESDSILLVFEEPGASDGYTFPQKRPTADELAQFEEALTSAEQYLMSAIGEREEIADRSVDAPSKYREKLARFANRQASDTRFPVEYRGLEGAAAKGPSIPVVVRGPVEAVNSSVEKLLEFIAEQVRDEAERDYTTSCPFPKAFRGRLIGKDGEVINKIRDDFDVEINFKADDDRVEIKGPPAKADAARAHVMSIAKKAEDETTHTLIIPAKFHGELIGKNGSQVQKYQERYDVQVFFPFATPDSSAESTGNKRRAAQGPNEVVIKGSKKGADSCKDDLWALYMLAQENSFSATVSVAQAQVPSLIGREGQEAKNLRLETGADIEFPKSAQPNGSGRADIVLKGTKEAVQKAKKALEERIKAFDQTVTEEIDVDKKYYRMLIGADGANLHQLVVAAGGDASQSSRIVQIPQRTSSEKMIKVVGPKDVVAKLVQSIKTFVDEQDSRVTETMEVDPGRHGALIGRGATVKKSIESDHSVTLSIPSSSVQGPARAQVKISGQPADIEKAKERINSILRQGGGGAGAATGASAGASQGAGELLEVPTRLHHVVSDSGRLFSTLRRDFKVTVDHNKQRPPPKAAQPTRTVPPTSMPLITDDASSSRSISADDFESNVQWEIVASALAPEDSEAMFPWILKGEADDVEKAKKFILAAIAAAGDKVTGYLTLPEPQTVHALVVGPGGAMIRKIREATGCNPRIPPSGEVGPIEIQGSKEKVDAAKDMIVKAAIEGLKKGPPARRGGGGF